MQKCPWTVKGNRIPCKHPETCPLVDEAFVDAIKRYLYDTAYAQRWPVYNKHSPSNVVFSGTLPVVDLKKAEFAGMFPVELHD